MDVTWLIFIRCHVNICLDTSIMFIRINTRKIFNIFGLTPLCMVTENRFDHHKIGDRNQIQLTQLWVTTLGDWKVVGSSLNFFQSFDQERPSIQWLKTFWLLPQKFGRQPGRPKKFGHHSLRLKVWWPNFLKNAQMFLGSDQFLFSG